MYISAENVLKAVDEQKADLTRLAHQFDADEFEVVIVKSLALVMLLQKLIAEQTKECGDQVSTECWLKGPTGFAN